MELERAIGLTAMGSAIASSPATGEIAYLAGCVVVLYDAMRNRQTFLKAPAVQKAIMCVKFSPQGKYIAAGEVRKKGF
jgi:hypothetical protein